MRHAAALLPLLLAPVLLAADAPAPDRPKPPAGGAGSDYDHDLKSAREHRANEFRNARAIFDHWKLLEARSVDDVFRLRTDGPYLSLVSPLIRPEEASVWHAVNVPPFDKGAAYIDIVSIGFIRGLAGQPLYRNFTLDSYALPGADESCQIRVTSCPGYIQIYDDWRIGAYGGRSVELVHCRPPEDDGAPEMAGYFREQALKAGGPRSWARLRAKVTSDAAGVPPRKVEVEARDFQALVREHPSEVEEFLRPLLREVGQEAVLTPDELTAWQVLSDAWRPDPEAERKVRGLLPALGDADFHARDEALGELRQTGRGGAAVLLHMDRAGLTPEQNRAVDSALARWSPLPAGEAARRRDDPQFLMDCLNADDRALRAAALERLGRVTGRDVSFDLDAGGAARREAVQGLRRRLGAAGPATGPARP